MPDGITQGSGAAIQRPLVHAWATHFAASRRIRVTRNWLRALSFIGMAVPILIGVYYTNFGADWVLATAKTTSAILAIPLFIISAWAVVNKWDDQLSDALESAVANRRFADRLQLLFDNPVLDEAGKWSALQAIAQEATEQNRRDDEIGFSDWELRIGHRKALKQLRLRCATCDQEPRDLASTSCDTCGRHGYLHRFS